MQPPWFFVRLKLVLALLPYRVAYLLGLRESARAYHLWLLDSPDLVSSRVSAMLGLVLILSWLLLVVSVVVLARGGA